jgi:aldose 1-epimerase
MNSVVNGTQFVIEHGQQRAVVAQVGATLREYQSSGHDVIHGFGPDEHCIGAAGQLLAPWPNRIEDGMYEFDGPHQLPVNEASRANAIHGLVRWHDWSPASQSDASVTLEHHVRPQDGYSFALRLEVTYTLSEDGLEVSTTVENRGNGAAPFGLGFHPWLTAGSDVVDGDTVHVPATTVIETDERMLPVRRTAVAGSAMDFRQGSLVGHAQLDTCFTDLDRDEDGVARVQLASPSGRSVEVWMDGSFPYVMIVTGDMLPADRRRRSLAIEPMTCPANAFRSGEDVIRLAPGEVRKFVWGIVPH